MRVIALCAAAGAAHCALNARLLPRPPLDPPTVEDRVAVLVPARDEQVRIEACLASLLAQERLPQLRILVLDDCSRDGTAQLARSVAADDPRVQVVHGAPTPPGWLGKAHACAQLADRCPDADYLVYVDADVRLAPRAVAAAVTLLRQRQLDLVSPFPRQEAGSWAERLIQPLLGWSWLTFVPLAAAERSSRPSLAVVIGQFLVLTRSGYDRAGGHAAVRHDVVEDLALARSIRRTGGRTAVVDGTALARCRMYDGWPDLREGYTKSLWTAFGSGYGAAAVLGGLVLLHVVPAVVALTGSRVALAGYAAGVAGRVVAARRVGGPVFPDAALHPVSVAVAAWLTTRSLWRRRRGPLSWKGRPL